MKNNIWKNPDWIFDDEEDELLESERRTRLAFEDDDFDDLLVLDELDEDEEGF